MKALSRVPCNNSDPDCFLKTAIKEGPPAVSVAEYKTLRPICFNCARSCPEYCIYFHTTLFMHRSLALTVITTHTFCLLLHFLAYSPDQLKDRFRPLSYYLMNCVFNFTVYRKINYLQTTSTCLTFMEPKLFVSVNNKNSFLLVF